MATIISSSFLKAGLKFMKSHQLIQANRVCSLKEKMELYLRICAWMNDAIHVQVYIIKLNPIWVRFGNINWQSFPISGPCLTYTNLNGING